MIYIISQFTSYGTDLPSVKVLGYVSNLEEAQRITGRKISETEMRNQENPNCSSWPWRAVNGIELWYDPISDISGNNYTKSGCGHELFTKDIDDFQATVKKLKSTV